MMKQLVTYIIAGLVLTMTGCVSRERYAAMRAGLDSINTVNRSGQPFTVAAVKPYVEFFDDHGTPNDRLLAHYLLGLAYYDHGEAPMALQCYQEALDYADTTATDCDYAQLSRVYAQMANVFYYQGLYRKQLELQQQATHYAWIGKDTLAALSSYEQESFAYGELGLLDSAIFVIEDVAQKYEQIGKSADAAISLGSAVGTLIDRDECQKARKYAKRYESESGFFDDNGNIDGGREVFYYYMGLLNLKESHIDSAEYWFRKELRFATDYYNQNGGAYGLAMVYEQLHQPDSAAKYYQYAYTMNDSAYKQMAMDKVLKMQSMYDYSRQQFLAQTESQRADNITSLLWLSIASLVIILLLTYIVINRINHKRKEAIINYKNSLILIEQAQYDIARLHNQEISNTGLIGEKEKIIEAQQKEIRKYKQKTTKANHAALEKKMKESDEYKLFLRYSKKATRPSEEDWKYVHIKMFELFPDFHNLLIAKKHLLNQNEFNACILVRMHFKPADLMNMLDISSSYSNKIRKILLKKLFDVVGKADDFDKAITSMY